MDAAGTGPSGAQYFSLDPSCAPDNPIRALAFYTALMNLGFQTGAPWLLVQRMIPLLIKAAAAAEACDFPSASTVQIIQPLPEAVAACLAALDSFSVPDYPLLDVPDG